MLNHAMPGKAMLNHKGLHGTVPSPAVAVPTGNSTTQHSCSVSHGGHAGAAPGWLWKAPGQWDLPGEGPAGTQRRGQLGAGGCQPGHAERPGQLMAALLTVTTGTTVPSRWQQVNKSWGQSAVQSFTQLS